MSIAFYPPSKPASKGKGSARGGSSTTRAVPAVSQTPMALPAAPSRRLAASWNAGRRVVGSESDQVGYELSDLLQGDGSDVRARRVDDPVNADGRRQVRLGDAEADDVNLAQPSSPRGRAGYDHDRVLSELEHIIGR